MIYISNSNTYASGFGTLYEKGRRRKMDPQDVHKKFNFFRRDIASLKLSKFDVNKLFDHYTFPLFSITNLMILD